MYRAVVSRKLAKARAFGLRREDNELEERSALLFFGGLVGLLGFVGYFPARRYYQERRNLWVWKKEHEARLRVHEDERQWEDEFEAKHPGYKEATRKWKKEFADREKTSH